MHVFTACVSTFFLQVTVPGCLVCTFGEQVCSLDKYKMTMNDKKSNYIFICTTHSCTEDPRRMLYGFDTFLGFEPGVTPNTG